VGPPGEGDLLTSQVADIAMAQPVILTIHHGLVDHHPVIFAQTGYHDMEGALVTHTLVIHELVGDAGAGSRIEV
jgi:hypothetical protein